MFFRITLSIAIIVALGTLALKLIGAVQTSEASECTHSVDRAQVSISDVTLLPESDALLIGTNVGVFLYAFDELTEMWRAATQCTVTTVVCDPNGSRIAAGLDNGSVLIWEVMNRQRPHTFTGHRQEVYDLAWSSDGTMLASAGWDNTSRVWNVTNGTLKHLFVGIQPSDQPSLFTSMSSVDFGPDNTLLVTGHSLFGLVTIWDMRTGEQSKIIETNTPRVTSVRWAPDGNHIAIASEGYYREINPIGIWDRAMVESVFVEWPDAAPTSLDWSPDSTLLAAAMGLDKVVAIWHVDTQELIHVLEGHTTYVNSVVFSQDGKHLVSSSFNEVIIWDVDTGEKLNTLKASDLSQELRN